MNKVVRTRLIVLLSLVLVPASAFAEEPGELAGLNQGRAVDAIKGLRAQLSTTRRDAISHQLLCRAFYPIELRDTATRECEAAVANEECDGCLTAIQTAVQLDRAKGAAIVYTANVLADADRSTQLARQLLLTYFASPARSYSAPAAKVHVEPGKPQLRLSDEAGARREYKAALALASSYAPAKAALRELPLVEVQ